MGADVIERIKGGYKRHLDRAKVELNTPDLLTRVPAQPSQKFRGDKVGVGTVSRGQEVVVRERLGSLVAYDRLTPVATCPDPPEAALRAVVQARGVAAGRIEQIHSVAGVVEIALCQ